MKASRAVRSWWMPARRCRQTDRIQRRKIRSVHDKSRKKSVDFFLVLCYYNRALRNRRPIHARVVELADSLDSGSSVHSGRAGSSPASRTKKTVPPLGGSVFFWYETTDEDLVSRRRAGDYPRAEAQDCGKRGPPDAKREACPLQNMAPSCCFTRDGASCCFEK